MKRLRRFLRWILVVSAVLLFLLVGTWLLRRPLLGPLVLGKVQTALAAALDADVEIADITGSWLGSVNLTSIRVSNGKGVVRSLTNGRIKASYSLRRLVTGDLSGLTSASIEVDAIHLTAPAAESTPDETVNTRPDLAKLLELLPRGVTVKAAACTIGTGTHCRRGKLDAALAVVNPDAPRTIVVRHAKSVLSLTATCEATPAIHGKGRIEKPFELLASLGISSRLRGGALEVDADWRGATAKGSARLSGVRIDNRSVQHAEASVEFTREEVQLRKIRVEAPGLRIKGGDLTVARRGNPFDQASGTLDVEVTDLSPYASLLPEEARSFLPISGGGTVRIDKGRLDAPGFRLQARGLSAAVRHLRLPLAVLHGEGSPAQLITGAADVTITDTTTIKKLIPNAAHWIPSDLKCQVRAKDGSLLVASLSATLPGVQLSGEDMSVPLVELLEGAPAAEWSKKLRGRLHARFEALSRSGLAEFVPESARPWLAARGDLRVRFTDGQVHIEPSSIEAGGALIQLSSGNVRGLLAGRPAGPVDVAVTIAEPRSFAVPGAGKITLSGKLKGRLDGDWSAPTISAKANFANISWRDINAARLSTSVGLSGHKLVLDALEVDGLAQGGVAETVRIRGRATLDLPTGKQPLTTTVDVRGRLQTDTLQLTGTLQRLRARLGAVDYELAGSVALPSEEVQHHAGEAKLTFKQVSRDSTLHASCQLLFAERISVSMEAFVAADKAPVLSFKGSVPTKADAPVGLKLALRGVAAGNILDALDEAAPACTVDATAEVNGRLSDPHLKIDLTAQVDGLAEYIDQRVADAAPFHLPSRAAVSIAISGTRKSLLVSRLSVIGSEDRFKLHASGELPVALDRDNNLVAGAPEGPFQLSVDARPSVRGGLRLKGRLTADDNAVRISTLAVGTEHGGVSGTAVVFLPTARLLEGPKTIGKSRIEGAFDLHGLPLAQLPERWTGLPQLGGKLSGTVTLRGTLAAPKPTIDLQMIDLSVKARGGTRLDSGKGRVSINARGASIERLEARMGAGSVVLHGKITPRSGTLWASEDSYDVDVTLVAKDALLFRGGGVKVRGDADLKVAGTSNRMTCSGDFGLTSGKFVKRITLTPDLRSTGGIVTERGFVPFHLDENIGSRISFDVMVQTRRPFQVRNNLLTADLNAELRLRGQGTRPRFEGSVTASDGRVRLPGSTLKIDSLLINFEPSDPYMPKLLVRGEGRRVGVRITALVQGVYDRPEVLLSSTPPLPQEDLIVLVTTGSLPESVNSRGLRGSAMLVGGYAAGEVIAYLFGSESTEAKEGLIDRLTIESGQEISRNGLETIRAQFELFPNVFLEAERDVFEDYNVGFIYRIRF